MIDRAHHHARALVACVVLFGCEPTKDLASRVTPAETGSAAITIRDPIIDLSPAAQKLDPALAPAYRAMNTGNFDEARAIVDAYRHDKGESARAGQAEFVLGITYHKQQLYGPASEHFARALRLEPGFLETYYYAGFACLHLGRLSEARAALAVFTKHDAGDANAVFTQGLVELEDDRALDAQRFIQRAIELAQQKRASQKDTRAIDLDLGRYHARLGDIHLGRDDPARAKESFAQAVQLRPDSPETWHKLDIVCERLGDAEGASRARLKYEELTARREGAGSRPR